MTSQNTFSSVFTSLGLIVTLCGVMAIGTTSFAQDTKKTDKKSDKVDISDLENKYWAPKDTDFSVVQNRTYSKEGRFALALQGGLIVNDEWTEGVAVGGTANYYFSERYGVELNYFSTEADLRENAVKLVDFVGGVQPDHGRLTGGYSVGFSWVPFYAKMSVLGKHIIYFDMAVTPTLGMTQYEQQFDGGTRAKSAFTYGLDVTQYFFFSKHWAVRLDLKNQWFDEDIAKYKENASVTPGVETGEEFRSKLTNTTLFMMGIMVYF